MAKSSGPKTRKPGRRESLGGLTVKTPYCQWTLSDVHPHSDLTRRGLLRHCSWENGALQSWVSHVNTNPTPRWGKKTQEDLNSVLLTCQGIFHWPRWWKRNETTDAKASTEGWREHYEADVRTWQLMFTKHLSLPGGQSVAQSQAEENGREWTWMKGLQGCAHVAGEWLPRPETITPYRLPRLLFTLFHIISSLLLSFPAQ